MEEENKSILRRFTDKLFGGLNMSWLSVIIYAVLAALVTAVLLILPIFNDTSFERVGVTLEAWILFAVILMANCKTPLESAFKTFVFFLISQPLIYLFQVPFSDMGWNLFRFYGYWFIWTLLTFPMAFVGWFITKKNWWSVLILSPILALLGQTAFSSGAEAVKHFPHLIVTCIFCVLQIVIYVYSFFPKIPQRVIGILIPAAVIIALALTTPQVTITVGDYLPDEPKLSESAVVSVDDPEIAEVTITEPEGAYISISAHKYGTTEVTVTDGDNEYRYQVRVFAEKWNDRVEITAVTQP